MRSVRLTLLSTLVSLVSAAAVAQESVQWQHDFEAARRIAGAQNKLVVVHFWAPWCGPCKQMDSTVFNQPAVGQRLAQNYVMVKVNLDKNRGLAQQFGVERIPADVVITPAGQVLDKREGGTDANGYVSHLQQVAIAAGHSPSDNSQMMLAGAQTSAPVNYGSVPATPPVSPADQQTQQQLNDRYGAILGQPQPTQPAPVTQHYASQAPAAPPAGGLGPRYQNLNQQPAPQQPVQQQPFQNYPPQQAPALTGPANMQTPQQSMPQMPQPTTQQQPVPQPPAQPQAAAPEKQPMFPRYQEFPVRVGEPDFAAQQQPAVQPPVQQQAAPQQQVVGQPQLPSQQVQRPANLGLEGFCPVTLTEQRKWQPGDKRFGVRHRGHVYLFIGQQQMQKFLANPDMYAPVFSGNDLVVARERQQVVQGRREHGVFYGGQVYLFTSEDSLQQFFQNPHRYLAPVVGQRQVPAAR